MPAQDSWFLNVMSEADRIKMEHREVARLYATYRNPQLLESLSQSKYGVVPGIEYPEFTLTDGQASKLLLAALIAERYALKSARGLLKHLTVAIVGVGGSGKTTYSILSAYGAMLLVGLSRERAMNAVVRNTFFEPLEFVEYVKSLVSEERWVPFIILDDVGAQISKYWMHIGQRYWAHLFSVLDHLKDWCGVLIMTARAFESIPARLRELADYVVEASESRLPSGTVLDVFKFYTYSDYARWRRRRAGLLYVDVLPPSVKMPKELWNRMLEVRKKTGLARLTEIEAELRKAAEKAKKRRGEAVAMEEVDLEEEGEGDYDGVSPPAG